MIDPQRKAFIEACEVAHGETAELSRVQINELCKLQNLPFPYWLVTAEHQTAKRGVWKIPSLVEKTFEEENALDADRDVLAQLATQFQVTASTAPSVAPSVSQTIVNDIVYEELIPDIHYGYVPFGFFSKLMSIIETKRFFPVFITGDSGEGKTLMAQQVCALLKRECIVVPISIETDSNDLLGGLELVNGNTAYQEGPVLTAMRRGAILLLDEVDRGSNKLICLHSILDGRPYYNKNTGETLYPAPGFNVIATANTKGKGSDDGKYLSQILDHAFLERFPITIEQANPPVDVQKQMLNIILETAGAPDEDFVTKLVRWAGLIRTSYKDEGTIDEQISSRRLIQICQTYSIFRDRALAINLCVNRFDQHIKKAFIDFYRAIDEKVENA